MHYRKASPDDSARLATLNRLLIRDEGHRNPMDLEQLTERMRAWLIGEFEAIVFEHVDTAIGYVLFRRETDFVYIRQFFVVEEYRRQGIGRNAMQWLRQHAWAKSPRLRIEVLIDNVAAREFWRAVGFHDYCITMEAELS